MNKNINGKLNIQNIKRGIEIIEIKPLSKLSHL